MASQKLDNELDYQKIAKERLIWLVKPLFIMLFVSFTVYPANVQYEVIERNSMIGFLAGAFFAVFLMRGWFTYYLVTRRKDTKNVKNRMPDEYYFGKVKEVLQLHGESKTD